MLGSGRGQEVRRRTRPRAARLGTGSWVELNGVCDSDLKIAATVTTASEIAASKSEFRHAGRVASSCTLPRCKFDSLFFLFFCILLVVVVPFEFPTD